MLDLRITDPHLMPAKHLMYCIEFLQKIHCELTGANVSTPAYVAPQPPAAPAAPFIAGAETSTIAPEESADTSVNPLIAFAQSAQTPANVPAPAVPVVGFPAPPGSSVIDLDSEYLPWDGRIHSSKKTKNADGSWKLRRGAGETFVIEVKAQLKAAQLAPPVTLFQGQPWPIPEVPEVPTPPAPDAVIVATPPMPPAPTGMTFAQLMQKVTASIQLGTLKQHQVEQATKDVGLPSFILVSTRPDLVPAIAAKLGIQ